MKNFFISYNKADEQWAIWIAWVLEEAGFSVEIQAWDFRPGENFVLRMQEAVAKTSKTIAVLSQNYLDAEYTQPEWAVAFTRDPQGKQRILIPIRVRECNLEGLHSPMIYIDLIGLSEDEARETILQGLKERAKPDEPPSYPGALNEQSDSSTSERVAPHHVQYPGTSENNSTAETQDSDIISNLPQGVPFFTGREEVLDKLYKALQESGATALAQRQAISGLGGIGKTQTAIAYAQRHRAEYKAILWAVAESRDSLISDYVSLANVLNLPERNVQEQNLVVAAVKRWLDANSDWLLILDNADEPKLVEEFLPANPKSHILLTSRAQVFDDVGILNPVELDEMSPDDARKFLLKRTGRTDLETGELKAIDDLTEELDYFPLALEQAGAYIKQLRSSFQDYLASYRKRGLELLEKGAGKYRKSVKTTWSLNFQQVEEASKASADLLRVSAFLSSDRIPNELIRVGAIELGPELSAALTEGEADPLALDEVLNPLIQYSLIHRDRKSGSYDIHRLVQVVLKDGMDDATKREWAERIVKVLARAFPDVDKVDYSEWNRIERLLPHAQVCIELIEQWQLDFLEVAQLLNAVGRYVHLRARLSESEQLYLKSLSLRENILGADDLLVAASLHNLAWLYSDQGKYAEAEPLYLRSIDIKKASLGSEHPDVTAGWGKLGYLYTQRGRYADAEINLRRSLEIRERTLPPQHYDIAESLTLLGNVYFLEDRYEEAMPLIQRGIEIIEKAKGSHHHSLVHGLGVIASIYRNYLRLDEAESLELKGLAIIKSAFGDNYPHFANGLQGLAFVYIAQNRQDEAEPLLLQAKKIIEESLGQEHPSLGYCLSNLAFFYDKQGDDINAETFYVHSLKILENALGVDHVKVARTLVDFGRFYGRTHKPYKGEPLIRRAISIFKKTLGEDHLRFVNALLLQAGLLHQSNRKGEAQKIEAQARKIQAKLNKKNKSIK
jgi:hypothetical protein